VIDIQAEDFVQAFDMTQATVGQVGYGFIGNAVVELFRPHCQVAVYDKAGYGGKERPPNVTLCEDLDGVVANAEVVFVAVPTPMKPSGECHTGIVEAVLQDIQNSAVRIGRDVMSFIVVIKSTMPPGFTARMQERYALRILFSPEFLTEANAVQDFKKANRVILGGEVEDARVVFKYFEGVWPDRQPNTWINGEGGHPDGPVQVIQCDSTEAEMVKLSTNVHLTARVMVSNELYQICQKLGIDYDTVRLLTQLDRRIGLSHMNVPGPDGSLGFGGHCFWKDTQSLKFITENLGTLGLSGRSIFHTLVERNLEIREDRDWEKQPGRAVINE
jgi:UDPglucose 6-dehydrogenase